MFQDYGGSAGSSIATNRMNRLRRGQGGGAVTAVPYSMFST
jgi:hypothetical protein